MIPEPTTPLPDRRTTHETDVLRRLVEQLFRAGGSEDVRTACQTCVDALVPGMRVLWHPSPPEDTPDDPRATRVLAGDGQRDLVLEAQEESDSRAIDDTQALPWSWIGRLAQLRLEQLADTDNLFHAVSRLARAERLQRALYNIADLAGTRCDTARMMRSLHDTIRTLMYAENFYIVLYDQEQDSIRFPYFVDTIGAETPDLDAMLPLDSIKYRLAWHLIRHNRPLMGSRKSLSTQVDGPLHVDGPEGVDWLGVPMHRGEQATGALVVRSYHENALYTTQDCELLTYVAQQLQNALEHRQAQMDLEERVDQRTRTLRETNRILQQQVLERQRGERLQSSLFRIAELANASDSLDTFYASVHRIIGSLIYARNFYIALLDEERQLLSFPYLVDEVDTTREPRAHGRGKTEYVLRHGEPLLADPEKTRQLVEQGEIVLAGTTPVCWLGVPLIWNGKVMGVLAVQSYSSEHTYGTHEQGLLTFVSYHIANALQRRQDNESLKQAYADMERRVVERTRALALANRDLRKQVAERERIERRLKYETLHDPLTGLPNRALMLQRLGVALKRFHADRTQLFAVLFIDLDRFKVINDSVGHLIGDDLLFQVGGRIRSCVKSRDTVARLGGDEFAVLLESIADEDVAGRVAARIIDKLHKPFRIGVKELFTSASIGISMASASYRRAEELLRDADSAMYSAKAGGRHRAETFDHDLRRHALQVLEIESDLRHGLERHAFEPYYQPVIRLDDGQVMGYEALLRWRHPERGVLLPGEFLGVAEDCGCIGDIDWQIFEQVCRHARTLVDGNGFISINLSARHFLSPDLEPRLVALLARYHVTPARLRLEVTEGTLLENPEHIKRTLEAFRDHGMHIALDDFGTGYSSLSYMHQYPIEVLKIDQSFVASLDESHGNQGNAVVRAILALASSLDIQVIAEGIETPMQQRILQRMGCRYGQGFLYARAQPAEAWLQTRPAPADVAVGAGDSGETSAEA